MPIPACFADARQWTRLEALDRAYRVMAEDPVRAEPKVIVNVPVPGLPDPETQARDADLMLDCELAQLATHLELEDDRVPSVRAQFGTAQIASAFGCPLEWPTRSLPAAKAPALASADDCLALAVPALDAGILATVADFHRRWRARLPAGVRIQHPDIQSPFNTAHLVRGNDILTDLYDRPEAVEALLGRIADFLVALVPELRRQIGAADDGFFDDWGARWRGVARISNCTTHLISPAAYRRFVLPHDLRLMEALGGGRIHYCGTHGAVIDAFATNPQVHGLDCDPGHHDFWALAPRLPERTVLCVTGAGADTPFVRRLLAGDWPAKRNLIVTVYAGSAEEGRAVLSGLRRAMPR